MVLAGLLTACQAPGPEARLADYIDRLARPLQAATAAPVRTTEAPPPRSSSLQRPIESGSLDALDFLSLRGCALQTTVAKRNSSLGRIAPPSQRLLLELAFLREAPPCVEYLIANEKPGLAQQLIDNMALKKKQLAALIFNATLGNLEYREFWRQSAGIQNYPEQTSTLVLTALELINRSVRRWLSGDYSASEREFELALSDIARGDGGLLLQALGLQAAYLDNGGAMIDRHLTQGPLCTNGLRPKAAPILRTVAQKYFVSGLQPRSARLNQRYHGLLPPILELEALLESELPEPYQRWRNRRQVRLLHDLEAPSRHVRQLQRLLGSCYAEFRASDSDAP